ncbi:carbohydrate ABC transporter permease [Paenibacillus whitsoniae]|uniref:Carbohydrate ABC transporter permease n=1 Tax=Paenibacillus whitsoniae TaxID=2496558 RepID=A0A3S0ARI2_9BACL|nr:carbohydrate ABC transporter permease [Paenibacillus whitsoniae]RTE10872.1 carbohydrate ABC transporter permease [Paenibacillus whitsoniae]
MRMKTSFGSKLFDAGNLLFMIALMLLMIYPLLYVFSASISNPSLVVKGEVLLFPKQITKEAYMLVAKDSYIWISYYNTIKYTVLQTVFTLVFTAMLAYPLAKKRLLGRRTIMLLIAFTMLFSGGLIPTFLVVKQLGLLNTTWALILPSLISTWYLFLMRTFFEGIPEELEDAATIDGCSALGVLFRVVLPLSAPIMATVALFTAVGQWNSFFEALIYLSDKQMYPLQIHLRNIVIASSAASQVSGSQDGDVYILETVKYSTIIFATAPILVVYPFIQKYFVQGSMIGGIKG